MVVADAQQRREQYEVDDQGVEEDGECQDDAHLLGRRADRTGRRSRMRRS